MSKGKKSREGSSQSKKYREGCSKQLAMVDWVGNQSPLEGEEPQGWVAVVTRSCEVKTEKVEARQRRGQSESETWLGAWTWRVRGGARLQRLEWFDDHGAWWVAAACGS